MKRLGMCGGICIAKPHFPFSASYGLAEKVMEKAKAVKKEISPEAIAIDFHILYDSVVTSIDDIRKKLHIKGESAYLTSKPFAVGTECGDPKTWAYIHSYERFKAAVKAITAYSEDSDVRELPSSQAHAVRDALFSEHYATQEADWKYLMKKYKGFAQEWKTVADTEKLYIDDAQENSTHFTYFLDALEAAKFVIDPRILCERNKPKAARTGQNGGGRNV
jgi:hypothetical protein